MSHVKKLVLPILSNSNEHVYPYLLIPEKMERK